MKSHKKKKKSEHLKQYQLLAVFYLSFPSRVTFNQAFLAITVEVEYSSFISSQKSPPPPAQHVIGKRAHAKSALLLFSQ